MDDGGWAFPVPNSANMNREEGMTLRDYFAAKAMAGMVAGDAAQQTMFSDGYTALLARQSYEIADAMLAARSAS